MTSLTLYINTRNRLDRQPTYDHLSRVPRLNPVLVCPESEVKDHLCNGRRAMARPENCDNLSKTRQWLLEVCPSPVMVLMDDDLDFFIRKDKESFHLRSANEGDLRELFKRIDTYFTRDGIKHLGLDMRQGNNHHDIPYVEVGRACSFLAYDVNFLRENKIRFDRLPLMQDFDVCLSLLKLGHPNRIITEFCYNERGGSNAKGGVSDYRSAMLIANTSYALAKYHEPFVKVVTKKSKSGWQGMEERVDVNVFWKKAYESSKQRGFF